MASWSRVQGIGIPLITAIEIVSIWVLSFILAIPEAIGFVMVPFEYRGEQYRTCMLNATTKFMEVLSICAVHPPYPGQHYKDMLKLRINKLGREAPPFTVLSRLEGDVGLV